jgi:hypothetical protein
MGAGPQESIKARKKTGASWIRAGPTSGELSRNYDRPLYVRENRELRSRRDDGG